MTPVFSIHMPTSSAGSATIMEKSRVFSNYIPVAYLSAAETAQLQGMIDKALRRDAVERRERRIAELKAELTQLDPEDGESLDPDRLREDRDERKRLEKEDGE